MTLLEEGAAAWAGLATIVAAGIAWLSKIGDRPKPRATEIDHAEAERVHTESGRVAAEVYGSLIAAMQADIAGLRKRLGDVESHGRRRDARCDRNIENLRQVVDQCRTEMRAGGLTPPAMPILETED